MSLERAKELAWQWWTNTERKILQDKPLREENFATIAESYLHELRAKTKKLDDRNQPIIAAKKHARHDQSIRLHLLPFFGSMSIGDIQPDDAERWLDQRLSSRPKKGERVDDGHPVKSERWSPPAHSTVQKDGVAFAAVIRHARLQFKIDTRFVPELPLPRKTEDTRRPRFYPDEWQCLSQGLYNRMVTRKGKRGPLSQNSIWFRTMLFFFVITLHGTGLRVAEAMRLQVKHLRRVREDAARLEAYRKETGLRAIANESEASRTERKRSVHAVISKAYDYRVIVASDNKLKHYTHQRIVVPTLDMRARFDQMLRILAINFPEQVKGGENHKDQISPDVWLFCHQDGKRIKSFDHGFDEVLRELKLLYYDGKRRSLTSIRHTYASVRIEARAADLKSIADNMGTTIEMLNKHYAQEIRELRAADLQVM